MIAWTLDELAAVLGGRIVLPAGAADPGTVRGRAQNDSREAGPGDVFFALPGTIADGHDFVPAVAAAGAALAITARPVDAPIAQLVVPEVLAALHALARETVRRVRALGGLTVIAVTGSNGKTTTKNMLRAVLERVGPTVAPRGSYNNHVGAPLSMLGVDEGTRYLVVELGTDGPGEIARHAALAAPDLGIVLKVGAAHLGSFGDLEGIARAKAELVQALGPAGHAILNADDPRVAAMAGQTAARVHWFGIGPVPGEGGPAAVRAEALSTGIEGTRATVRLPGREPLPLRLAILGEHHVHNALAALAAVEVLGLDPVDALAALAAMPRAERWRMELLHRDDGVTVINDAYNASPDSMAAALKTLAALAGPQVRTVAVLGEMLGLGEAAAEEHDRIGRLVVRLNIGKLLVIGEGARPIHLAATQEGSWDGESAWVADQDSALALLAEELRSGDVVLVKASGGVRLRFFGDRLAGVAA